ncbi:MAG: hypothetical protein A2231_10955 [Candidatus Firestonebacteria bacterium RIFOXYA2_FULL_40_8]|nr:MAG: hypothetical protein A2231_10955 [Candidatus Firestonebacteria bacterium RIFOXYA2_FULL_40_8]
MKKFTEELIAPCGINCGVCSLYLAYSNGLPEKKGNIRHCIGCKPRNKKCTRCKTGNINKIRFCYECSDFPCEFLKRLEKRYLSSYKRPESPIKNLKDIKKLGVKKFLALERKKWKCPKCSGVVSVHNGKCFACEKVISWRN